MLGGLWRTVKAEWWMVVLLVSADVYAWGWLGVFTGVGWMLATIGYVFSMWLARVGCEGWEEAIRLAEEAKRRSRE